MAKARCGRLDVEQYGCLKSMRYGSVREREIERECERESKRERVKEKARERRERNRQTWNNMAAKAVHNSVMRYPSTLPGSQANT